MTKPLVNSDAVVINPFKLYAMSYLSRPSSFLLRAAFSRSCRWSHSSHAQISFFKIDGLPGQRWLLTLLPTDPPVPSLAIGTATKLPPSPASFTANPGFVTILNEVLAQHAHYDVGLVEQASACAATGRGFIHLSDSRNPPDYGRVAEPEDIFGSVEVDAGGTIIGTLQPSGTYRIVTNQGILGLSPFLRAKLVERLRRGDEAARQTESVDGPPIKNRDRPQRTGQT